MSTMDGTDKYSLCDQQKIRQIAKAMLRIDYEGLTEEQFEWFFETFHLNYEWEHRYMAFARAAIKRMESKGKGK